MSKTRTPKYGEEVYVPSHHADGHWTNGIVNSGVNGTHERGSLLVVAPGHAKSKFVSVRIDAYGKHWMWPEDRGEKLRGATAVRYLGDDEKLS